MAILTETNGPDSLTGTTGDDFLVFQEADEFGVDTGNGGDGNDVIIGDLDLVFVDDVAFNATIANATNLDISSRWSTQSNPLVFDDTVPYATIIGQGTGEFDVFSVTVGAGETLTADIDFGNGGLGGPGFDSELKLFNGASTLLADNDDAGSFTQGGLGSTSILDSFLTWTNTTSSAQRVYLQVEEFNDLPITVGATYLLNVSVSGHVNSNIAQQDDDRLSGGDGNDFLIGNDGNDTLRGGDDDDTLIGGNGDDDFNTGIGTDLILGGAGRDYFFVTDPGMLSVGDVFDGGDHTSADYISIRSSGGTYDFTNSTLRNWEVMQFSGHSVDRVVIFTAEQLQQFVGDSAVFSGFGLFSRANDATATIQAQMGTATVLDLEGVTLQDFISGHDVIEITGDSDAETITGTHIADTINGNGGNDFLVGGDGDDFLTGGVNNDTIHGGTGNDTILGAAGNDSILAGANEDRVTDGANDSFFDLGSGDDLFFLNLGTDRVLGQGDNDRLFVQDAAFLSSGDDFDGGSNTTADQIVVQVDDGTPTTFDFTPVALSNWETLIFFDNSPSDGSISAHFNAAQLAQFTGGGEFTSFVVVDASEAETKVTLQATMGAETMLDASGLTFDEFTGDDFFRVIGDADAEHITGTSIENLLVGNGGNDTLVGGSQRDTLIGGRGDDSIVGGNGADILRGDDPFGLLRLNEGSVVDQYVEATTFDAMPTDAYTVEWLFQSFGAQDNDAPFVSYATASSENEFLVFGAEGSDISVFSNGIGISTGVNTATVFDGDVHRMSVSVDTTDGTNGRISLYIDGVEVFSGPGEFARVGEPIEAGGTFIVGQEQDELGGGFQPFQALQGSIGDIRVWSEERTQTDIDATKFTQFDGPDLPGNPSLVANWQVDPFSGAISALTGTQALDLVSAGANPFTTDISDLQDNGGNDTIAGGIGADDIFGGSGNDSIDGGEGDDSIQGGAGDDTLLSGEEPDAADTLRGGSGDDILEKQSFTDRSAIGTFDGGDDTDLFFFSASGSTTPLANQVVDLSAGRILFNGSDRDILIGIENVRVAGDAGIVGDGNANHLSAVGDGANNIEGGDGDDTIDGGDGDDTIEGGAGADDMDGGGGTNTLSYASSGGGVLARLDFGIFANSSPEPSHAAGDTVANFANVIGSAFADRLAGDAGDNSLSGGDGDDQIIDYRGGRDTMLGGGGDDSIEVETRANTVGAIYDGGTNGLTGDLLLVGFLDALTSMDLSDDTVTGFEKLQVREDRSSNTASVSTRFTDAQISQFGEIEYFSPFNETPGRIDVAMQSTALDLSGTIINGINPLTFDITGTGAADSITGSTIADSIDGGIGADSIEGGAGNDTLNGGAGDDRLIGGVGADSLDGGDNTDTADYSASNGAVIMAPGGGITGGHATGDTLVSIENIIGGLFSDTLRGDGGVNQLDGGGGNDILVGGGAADILNGGAGSDTLIGGAGADVQDGGNNSDTYLVGNGDMLSDTGTVGYDRAQIASAAGDTLDISGWSGINRVNGNAGDDSIDGATATQNLVLDGAGNNDTLIGGSGHDVMLGGEGADSLIGGGGNDTMLGGTGDDIFEGGGGNDLFFIGESGDVITDAGIGTDKAVISDAAGLTINVSSWLGLERINGFTGGDSIDATGSNVAMVFAPSAGADTILGGNGNDTVYAGTGADEVSGSAGNDALIGAAGNDTLNGGADNDFLLGGADADTFAFDNNFGRDVVRDYVDETDMISFQGHSGVNNIGDLSINEVGANTIVTLTAGGTDQITIVGINHNLESTDFLF